MAWTLVVALCIVAYVLVALFSKKIRIFQRKAFVYPSEADIDQILPPEIIEAILCNVDLRTLQQCCLVSKYWRYHAEKDFILAHAVESEKAPRATLAEIAEELTESNLPIKWLTYEDNYKPLWHAQDGRYIKSTGKKFIDIQYSSLLNILKSPKNQLPGVNDNVNKYLVRTRLKMHSRARAADYIYFYTNNEWVSVLARTLPDHVRENLGPGAQIEILEELSDLRSQGKWSITLTNPARIVDSRNFIGGVPIDDSIFNIMYLLFLPCILKDFWNASTETKDYLTTFGAAIGLLGAFIASTVTSYEGIRESQTDTAKAQMCFGFGIFGFILMSAIFYPYALEVGLHCTIETALALYGIFIFSLHDNRCHPNRKQVLFLAFCLAVSIIDWKLTVDAFKNGTIWFTLIYNLSMHLVLWAWAVFTPVCRSALTLWRIPFDHDVKAITQFFALAVLSVFYMTCAAPHSVLKL